MVHDVHTEPTVHRLWGTESGATAVEYAIMAALIATVIIGTVMALGVTTDGLFADLLARWP